jgi:hypothetical protein
MATGSGQGAFRERHHPDHRIERRTRPAMNPRDIASQQGEAITT